MIEANAGAGSCGAHVLERAGNGGNNWETIKQHPAPKAVGHRDALKHQFDRPSSSGTNTKERPRN